MIILDFFQINGEAEKILKEFSIPKKGRLVSFPSFQTISGVTEVFLVLSREFSRAIILDFVVNSAFLVFPSVFFHLTLFRFFVCSSVHLLKLFWLGTLCCVLGQDTLLSHVSLHPGV